MNGDFTVFKINDVSDVELLFRDYGDDLAALIVEPLLGTAGCLAPSREFFEFVNRMAANNGTLIVADEAMVGLRLGLRPVSVELGLEPDLMTMGKAIESGMPVTAVLGTPEAFNVVESGKVVCYGSYQGNPVVTAAASATLKFLRKQNFEDLFDYEFQLQKMMGDCFSRQGVAISISGHPTIYSLWFSERARQRYTEALSLIRHDVSRFVYEELGRQGVVTLPSPWGKFFFTFAHDEQDFEDSAAAFESAAKQLSRSNLLKRHWMSAAILVLSHLRR